MSEQYGGPHETRQERERKIHSLNLKISDLFDTSKPWVLVENGSLLGYFDWVRTSRTVLYSSYDVCFRCSPQYVNSPKVLSTGSHQATSGTLVAVCKFLSRHCHLHTSLQRRVLVASTATIEQ
jgi:hypothetical protein